MHLGSTSQNINLLTILTATCAILGLIFFTVTPSYLLLTVVSFYILNLLGNWMMLHRYYSHRNFEFKHKSVKWIFTVLSVLAGRGSPLGWSYLHRKHHAYSDTEKDPHSPKYLGYKIFGFEHYRKQEEEKMQIFIVKDLMTTEQLFIHKWYIAIIASFVIIMSLLNVELLYFGWVLPAFFVHLSQVNFNYFGHMYGYRNYETKDDSRNNVFMFPFILGEAWHNNHHANPKEYSTKIKDKEYDPITKLIDLIKQ